VIALPDAATITDEAGNRGPLSIKPPPMRGVRIETTVEASLVAASVEEASIAQADGAHADRDDRFGFTEIPRRQHFES
jgi:hypothetical protein